MRSLRKRRNVRKECERSSSRRRKLPSKIENKKVGTFTQVYPGEFQGLWGGSQMVGRIKGALDEKGE